MDFLTRIRFQLYTPRLQISCEKLWELASKVIKSVFTYSILNQKSYSVAEVIAQRHLPHLFSTDRPMSSDYCYNHILKASFSLLIWKFTTPGGSSRWECAFVERSLYFVYSCSIYFVLKIAFLSAIWLPHCHHFKRERKKILSWFLRIEIQRTKN